MGVGLCVYVCVCVCVCMCGGAAVRKVRGWGGDAPELLQVGTQSGEG